MVKKGLIKNKILFSFATGCSLFAIGFAVAVGAKTASEDLNPESNYLKICETFGLAGVSLVAAGGITMFTAAGVASFTNNRKKENEKVEKVVLENVVYDAKPLKSEYNINYENQ